MPVFNAETYLTEAVESILGQTYADWELVVIDDGSEDGSRAILDRFATRDPRIRVLINEANLGVSATLNRGWREAQGEYIARLDADDVALPGRFTRQVDFLDSHPSVAVVGGAITYMDADGRPGSTRQMPTSSRVIRSTLLRHNCLAHPTVMMRRTVLERVGGYRVDHVEDYDLWLRVSEHFELANLAEPLVLYRLHPQQVSLRVLETQVRRGLAVRSAARSRRESHFDPLDGIGPLTPADLDGIHIADSELRPELEAALLTWATLLADQDRREEADQLVAEASRSLGTKATRAFAAAAALSEAERLRVARRPVAATTRVLRALRCEPRYASTQLAGWVEDRLRSWGLLGHP